MSALLLVFSLFHTLNGAPVHPSATSQVESADSVHISAPNIMFGTRAESDIIITCLATIIACTWTAMHPNIDGPADSGWDILKRRIRWMTCALIAPETVTTFALRQRLAASKITERYNQEIVEPSLPGTERATTRAAAEQEAPELVTGTAAYLWQTSKLVIQWFPKKVYLFFCKKTPREKRNGRVEKWKTAHGFFVQMGGFMLSRDGQPLETLSDISQIVKLIKQHKIAAVTTSEEDLQDRSKGDAISKGLVILQTTWFFTQCVARWSTGLVVTELEVVTLGFVVLNGLTYALWWDKPQNVGVPIYFEWLGDEGEEPRPPTELSKTSLISHFLGYMIPDAAPSCIRAVAMPVFKLMTIPVPIAFEIIVPFATMIANTNPAPSGKRPLRVPMFFSARFDRKYLRVLLFSMACVALLFGIVHLAPAWSLFFPSHRYMVLWRVCAIIMTVIPPMIIPFTEIIAPHAEEYNGAVPRCLGMLVMSVILLYSASRITLFVIALVSLQDLPPGAFITIDWLSSFPHV